MDCVDVCTLMEDGFLRPFSVVPEPAVDIDPRRRLLLLPLAVKGVVTTWSCSDVDSKVWWLVVESPKEKDALGENRVRLLLSR